MKKYNVILNMYMAQPTTLKKGLSKKEAKKFIEQDKEKNGQCPFEWLTIKKV